MKDIISSHLSLSEDQYQALISIAKVKKIDKQTRLIRSGEYTNKIYFLDKGALRAYRNVDGMDYTHFFFVERWFVTDFTGFLTKRKCDLNIEALTDSVCFEFLKEDIEKLNQVVPKLEKLWKIVAEKAYLFTAKRLEDMQTKDLHQRYQELLAQHPKLFLSFPQKHIASYLGVAEQSLSRIKKKR